MSKYLFILALWCSPVLGNYSTNEDKEFFFQISYDCLMSDLETDVWYLCRRDIMFFGNYNGFWTQTVWLYFNSNGMTIMKTIEATGL